MTSIGQTETIETERVDQWLWVVRVFKTRSLATGACKGGHVRINGRPAKPASAIRVGDRVEVRAGDHHRVLEVVALVGKRVAAPVAATCVVDHSPPPPPRDKVTPMFRRDRGTGRPTKKDRRSLDRLRGR
jgi:ribosome-associated heat shock protein Hsp15